MAMNFGTEFPRQMLPYNGRGSLVPPADANYMVYIHINKENSRCYVGITHHINNPEKRWHCGKGYHHSPIFERAIKKYGWDNFDHMVEFVGSKQDAYRIERELIKFFKTLGMSYNVAEGGEGVEAMAEETKEKLRRYSPWIKGRHHTKEAIEKIKEAGRRRKMSAYCKAKLQEANRKRPHFVSEAQRLRVKEFFSKPVLQIDKNTNVVLAEYSSATEAEMAFCSTGRRCGHINQVCNGIAKRKTCYGYKWRYKEA